MGAVSCSKVLAVREALGGGEPGRAAISAGHRAAFSGITGSVPGRAGAPGMMPSAVCESAQKGGTRISTHWRRASWQLSR